MSPERERQRRAVSWRPADLDLESPSVRDDPYPVYRWFREHDPVHRLDPHQPDSVVRYLLTRWEDVAAGLKNPNLKRTIHGMALWNQPLEALPPAFVTYAKVTRSWPLFRDPPQHAAVRRPVNRVIESASEHEDFLGPIIDRALNELEAMKSFDAVEDYARRIPLEFDLATLGIQGQSWRKLGEHLTAIGMALGNNFDRARITAASFAMEQLTIWIREAIDLRKNFSDAVARAPFLDRLLALEQEGVIDGPEQVTATALLLMQAAQDTTSSLIGNGILTLLKHPQVIDWIGADPSRVCAVVDEVLRFESPVQQITRHAAVPIEIRGVTVQRGEGVSFLLGAANRDPRAFVDPETFNPTIPRAQTAAFGFGPHSCPGANLARSTAVHAWSRLFARFPRLRRLSAGVSWRPTVTFRAVAQLPVAIE